MSKRYLLKLPEDFDGNLRAMLGTKLPPEGTSGSRKIEKPKKKGRKRKAAKKR